MVIYIVSHRCTEEAKMPRTLVKYVFISDAKTALLKNEQYD
ncbi:hypothetical protein [Bacillus sp. SM2101]|nr:hypothetical protein [Bacillus sp. SM2101]